eukprot:SAG11_NODE_4418_length_1903_cov_5.983925_2_plen_200_part_00
MSREEWLFTSSASLFVTRSRVVASVIESWPPYINGLLLIIHIEAWSCAAGIPKKAESWPRSRMSLSANDPSAPSKFRVLRFPSTKRCSPRPSTQLAGFEWKSPVARNIEPREPDGIFARLMLGGPYCGPAESVIQAAASRLIPPPGDQESVIGRSWASTALSASTASPAYSPSSPKCTKARAFVHAIPLDQINSGLRCT